MFFKIKATEIVGIFCKGISSVLATFSCVKKANTPLIEVIKGHLFSIVSRKYLEHFLNEKIRIL